MIVKKYNMPKNYQANSGCPVTETFKFFGDFRILQILWKIDTKGIRFKDFLEELSCMNAVTLTNRLNYLIELGFIQKQKFNETPPRVEYSLTDKGTEIKKVVMQIADYGVSNGMIFVEKWVKSE